MGLRLRQKWGMSLMEGVLLLGDTQKGGNPPFFCLIKPFGFCRTLATHIKADTALASLAGLIGHGLRLAALSLSYLAGF